ncbi:signaling lymphocytic activation molecule-like [Megalops cyprinoides]|uniref:signaling lymphocytic activation molecule-like n=1 Tax=Megalops cyprinoides TaxID=118141 RepID=UPI001863C66D|nr:signaling lymphocytic activation molecule-like [Megalops cyprinoides]
MVVKGSSYTELIDQFRDRLQWNSTTGLFTITQLRAEDSGEYKVDSKDGQKKLVTFQLQVYERVSTPTVTVTAVRRLNCSVLCSVENGREVTLSWQREGVTLSHTSSPDLNTNLSLPLEIGGPKHTYYCEVKNPVSSQRHLLDIPENCTSSGETQEDDTARHRSYIIPIAAGCSLAGILAVAGLTLHVKRGRRQHTEDTGSSDVQYAVINHSNQTETQQRNLPELDTSAQNSKLTTVYDELRPREETPATGRG